jgi:hypothetical protein
MQITFMQVRGTNESRPVAKRTGVRFMIASRARGIFGGTRLAKNFLAGVLDAVLAHQFAVIVWPAEYQLQGER